MGFIKLRRVHVPGPDARVDVASQPQPDGRGRSPAVSAVASMRRGDTVIEVRSTLVRGDAPSFVLAVAQGMRRQDAGWPPGHALARLGA